MIDFDTSPKRKRRMWINSQRLSLACAAGWYQEQNETGKLVQGDPFVSYHCPPEKTDRRLVARRLATSAIAYFEKFRSLIFSLFV